MYVRVHVLIAFIVKKIIFCPHGRGAEKKTQQIYKLYKYYYYVLMIKTVVVDPPQLILRDHPKLVDDMHPTSGGPSRTSPMLVYKIIVMIVTKRYARTVNTRAHTRPHDRVV